MEDIFGLKEDVFVHQIRSVIVNMLNKNKHE